MNNFHDNEYHRLLELVLTKGKHKGNRTDTPALSVFGAQARFNLAEGFPLLTTKKVHMKSIIHELLWFLSGSTNIKYLVDNGVHIWDDNAYDHYKKTSARYCLGVDQEEQTMEWFLEQVKNRPDSTHGFGELGEGTYGRTWRGFPYFHLQSGAGLHVNKKENPNPAFDPAAYVGLHDIGMVDQIGKVINTLRTDPDSRRMIVSAWHPYWVDHCALPPCHVMFHFNTEELTDYERLELAFDKTGIERPEEYKNALPDKISAEGNTVRMMDEELNIPRRRLNCLLYQRSCDLFLGIPFNIASYSLLTHMIAQVTNMVPGEFVHTYGDLHIYDNHINQVNEQLSRGSYAPPKLILNPEIKDINDFKFEDIKIENYQSHPAIKAPMAV